MLSHRPRDYVVPLTFSHLQELCRAGCALSHRVFSLGHQCLWSRMNESLLSFVQTHALLLERAVLAAPKRHLVDKEMGESRKIQCQLGIHPQLTATERSDDGKRHLPAPTAFQSMPIPFLELNMCLHQCFSCNQEDIFWRCSPAFAHLSCFTSHWWSQTTQIMPILYGAKSEVCQRNTLSVPQPLIGVQSTRTHGN